MSLKRGIVHTFLTQAPLLLLFFISSTLMTRMLGDTGRGEYAVINNLTALLAMVMELGVGFSITYFTARSVEGERSAIGTATALILVDIVVIPIVLWTMATSPVLSDVFMPKGRTHWTFWAYVLSFTLLGILNSAIYSGAFLGRKLFKQANFMALFSAGLGMIGYTSLYVLRAHVPEDRMLQAVLAITITVLAITSIIWCILYAWMIGTVPRPAWQRTVWWPVVSFALVNHASNLINLINYRFDVWVVDQYHGPSELGLYAVAVGLGQLLFNIPMPFVRVVQPYLFGQRENEMIARFKAISRLNFTFIALSAVALALVAPWVVPRLFGAVFARSVAPLYILLPGILFSGATKLLAILVVQGGLQRFNLLATAIGAVITIGLDLLLIPHWGINGAAFVSSISYLGIFVTVLIVIRTRMGIRVHDIFLTKFSDVAFLRGPVRTRVGQ